MDKTVAERMKQTRKARGWTQEELARRSGVARDVIAMTELGRTKRPRQLEELAKALDVSPAWLLFGDQGIDSLTEAELKRAAKLKRLPDHIRQAIEQMIDTAPEDNS